MTTWSQRAQFAVQDPLGAIASLGRHFSELVFPNAQIRLFRQVERYLASKQYDEAARAYRAAIAVNPERSTVYDVGQKAAEDSTGDLNDGFYSAVIDQLETEELRAMFRHLAMAPELFQPSRLWLYFMTYNALQLETGGIDNFKRTVNSNYFSWTAHRDVAEQLDAVMGSDDTRDRRVRGLDLYFKYLSALYDFVKSRDELKLLDTMAEPQLGNPICCKYKGIDVSQDICNTALELNTIVSAAGLTRQSAFTVYELGAGCGRLGYGLLTCFPNARYVAIDIPAALYVAQWHLGGLFPEKPGFKWREFSNYENVQAELEGSRYAFLTPDQAGMLPDKSCDVFINICSLQEMSRRHVDYWFSDVDRLCRGVFYYKQYKKHYNVMDCFSLNKEDYPVKDSWRAILDRESPTFPSLFEMIYKV